MSEETSANKANFEEVESHLKLLNTRLKCMLPGDDSAQAKLLDDYEDYYDRSIGLRVMENNTLRVQLEEKVADIKELASRHARWTRVTWVLVGMVLILFTENIAPGAMLRYVSSVSFTAGDVTSHLAGMLLVWWLCR